MASPNDLSGQRFGRLQAISLSPVRLGKKRAWRCACDCGAQPVIKQYYLTSGETRSCGCLNSDVTARRSSANLAGLQFGKLTALEPLSGRDANGNILWRCVCVCGGERVARAATLSAGLAISCGCAYLDATVYMPDRARAYSATICQRRRARKLEVGGSFTVEEIEALYRRQRGRCANGACRVKLGRLFHRDHVISLADRGSNDIIN
ncbi:MAG: hypothetical protein K2X60_07095, partial [Xanthobacteraceae bacterium]|nr:hypothetical protein [Xanthobacteraceae bacterium]